MHETREWYEELPSTQDRAIALARAGAGEGTRVVARRQRHGRGRLDHTWESPDGGLYLSMILAAPESHAGLLPLAVGTVLAESLGRQFALPLRVKWPNDLLLVDGGRPSRKLAGILVDRVASPRLGSAAVVGVGVNVVTDIGRLPAEIRDRVAVLSRSVHPPPSPDAVEPLVVDAVLEAGRAVRDPAQLPVLRARCRAVLFGVGRPARVDERPVGTILALWDEGELWVEDRGERMAIRAGDLRVEEAP